LNAQTKSAVNISVSPTSFEYNQYPGSTIKDKIRLKNNSRVPLNLEITIKKLAGSDINETKMSNPGAGDQFVNWIKFDQDVFTVAPGDYLDVPFTISIPSDAAFGYYWLFNISQNVSLKTQNGAGVVGAIGIPVLLQVKANGANATALLNEFKVKNFITEFLPADFSVKIQNTGNIHLKPRGNIFIRQGDKDIGILEVNQDLGSVLPGGTRNYEASWNDGFLVRVKDKDDPKNSHLEFNWNKVTSFRIGKYTANLVMVYDNGKEDVTLEGSVNFWVFPYKIFGAILIVLILIIVAIRFLIRRYINREIKKYRR